MLQEGAVQGLLIIPAFNVILFVLVLRVIGAVWPPPDSYTILPVAKCLLKASIL